MENIPNEPSKNEGWYAKWHKHPHHHIWQWLLLVIIVGSVGWVLVNRIREPEVVSYGVGSKASFGQNTTDELNVLNNNIIKELKSYETTADTDQAQALENLKSLGLTRKELVISRMKTGDVTLSAGFLPEGILKRLPEDVRSLFETKFNVQGEMTALHVDGINDEDSRVDYELTTSQGKKYQVYFNKGSEPAFSGKVKANFSAVGINDSLFVAYDSGQNSVQTTSTLAPDITGAKSLLVILINFANDTSQSISQIDATNAVFNNPDSTNALIKEGSYNKVSLTGTVTPWYTISASVGTTCDATNWASLAEKAATAGGYTPSNYNYVMYYLTGVTTSVCNWGGMGYVGGRQTWINGRYAAHGSKAHELGHNFGAWHSGFYTCGTAQISSTCTLTEYGEYNSKMGSANNYQFNSLYRSLFAWIPSTQVKAVSSNGVYTVYSDYSTNTIEPKILKISKPNTNEYYFITFKQALGFDAALPSGNTKGATIYVWTPSSGYHTKMLTMTPGSMYTDSALWDGGSFVDTANGITVTQASHTPETVTLSVTFGAGSCSPANPTVSIAPTSQTSSAGGSLTYSVTVKNNNNSYCGTQSYSITSSLPSGLTSNTASLSLSSGQTGTTSLVVTSNSSLVDGSYNFVTNVSDTSGLGTLGSVNASYVVFTPVVDTTVPIVSIVSPTDGTVVSSSVVISASATDNIAVSKVEFYIDGSRVASDTSAPYSYKWNVNKRVNSGSHTITATAYDTSGNSASSSVVVTK